MCFRFKSKALMDQCRTEACVCVYSKGNSTVKELSFYLFSVTLYCCGTFLEQSALKLH